MALFHTMGKEKQQEAKSHDICPAPPPHQEGNKERKVRLPGSPWGCRGWRGPSRHTALPYSPGNQLRATAKETPCPTCRHSEWQTASGPQPDLPPRDWDNNSPQTAPPRQMLHSWPLSTIEVSRTLRRASSPACRAACSDRGRPRAQCSQQHPMSQHGLSIPSSIPQHFGTSLGQLPCSVPCRYSESWSQHHWVLAPLGFGTIGLWHKHTHVAAGWDGGDVKGSEASTSLCYPKHIPVCICSP